MLVWGGPRDVGRITILLGASDLMAAAPPLRVRDLSEAYHPVRLVPGASEIGVEKAIAGAVGLAVGTSFLKTICVAYWEDNISLSVL